VVKRGPELGLSHASRSGKGSTLNRVSLSADHIFLPDSKVFSVIMLPAVFTRTIIHGLDWVASRLLPADPRPMHQRTGTRGEEDAYFHLRKLGYAIVARNFRSPRCRGEIDLIGWDDDVLCFIEVKTRTSRDVKPAEAAVDRHKRREVAEVAREYRRRLPPSCQWRFDIVSVYYEHLGSRPQFEVFRNASLSG
jgi:putative endonuclease